MLNKNPYILSLIYKERIAEICKKLPDVGISNFAMYAVFNDQSRVALSNLFPFVKTYYRDNLYKEDYTFTSAFLNTIPTDGYYLCNEGLPCSEQLQRILTQEYSYYPMYYLVRKHTECTFIFCAINDKQTDNYEEFYNKTKKKFEEFCSVFVNGCLDLLVKYNLNYKFSFILNDQKLRDAVIKGGYNDKIGLTSRQTECLWLAMQGNSVKKIAKLLKISYFTVEKHFKNIREVFNCETIVVAIYEAIQRGLIGRVGIKERAMAPLLSLERNLNNILK